MHTTLVVIEQNYLIIFFCILAVGKMLLNIFYLVVCILARVRVLVGAMLLRSYELVHIFSFAFWL